MMRKYEIEKFNGINFMLCKLKIQAILTKERCLDAIEDRPREFTDDEKWNEMNDNAISSIHLAIADGVLSSISELKSTKVVWDTPINLYKVKSLHNKIFLKRRLYTLRMAESSSITGHINTLNALFTQLTSDEFDAFCQHGGIKKQFTTAYTPQQNGVVERMNRTLLDRTRAMLRTAGLAKSFCTEAVKIACHVINHSPSVAIDLKTPMEVWSGKPADYSRLHTFGSPVYVLYNKQERSKLNSKSRKCIFLGYADGVEEFRLWDNTAHKLIVRLGSLKYN